MQAVEGTAPDNLGLKKPYAPPRLVIYGDVRRLTRGATHTAHTDGGVGSKPCWVAEVLYGADDPRTLLLRHWLRTFYARRPIGAVVVWGYKRVGRPIAAAARVSRTLRNALRPLFETGWRMAVVELHTTDRNR